jgi:hypothetical protein
LHHPPRKQRPLFHHRHLLDSPFGLALFFQRETDCRILRQHELAMILGGSFAWGKKPPTLPPQTLDSQLA